MIKMVQTIEFNHFIRRPTTRNGTTQVELYSLGRLQVLADTLIFEDGHNVRLGHDGFGQVVICLKFRLLEVCAIQRVQHL